MLVSTGAGWPSEAVLEDWRITNVKENTSSSSLLSLSRKLGEAGLGGSGSYQVVSDRLEYRTKVTAQTDLNIFDRGNLAERPGNGNSGSWKCIGNDVDRGSFSWVRDSQRCDAHCSYLRSVQVMAHRKSSDIEGTSARLRYKHTSVLVSQVESGRLFRPTADVAHLETREIATETG